MANILLFDRNCLAIQSIRGWHGVGDQGRLYAKTCSSPSATKNGKIELKWLAQNKSYKRIGLSVPSTVGNTFPSTYVRRMGLKISPTFQITTNILVLHYYAIRQASGRKQALLAERGSRTTQALLVCLASFSLFDKICQNLGVIWCWSDQMVIVLTLETNSSLSLFKKIYLKIGQTIGK